jgi:hypothetical protein
MITIVSTLFDRRTYDLAFKHEALRLVLEEGCSAVEVERNLGTELIVG